MKTILIFVLTITVCHYINAQSVGIGTTTPNASAQLDVTSTTKGLLIPRMTAAQRNAITSPIAGLMVYETTTNSFCFFNGSAWSQIGSGGASPWTISGNNIYNSNTGNVGIGTISPTSKFHTYGNALIENGNLTLDDPFGTVYFKNGTQNKAYIQLRSTDDIKFGTTPLTNLTGDLIFETQGIARMTVKPDGNVGIGYSNPAAKLAVNGSLKLAGNLIVEDGLMQVTNTTDNHSWLMQYVNTGNTATSRLRFVEQGLDRLSLLNGGNIGIGTTTPTELLDVNGNIRTNSDVIIDKSTATMQLKNGSGTDKGFVQLSGNDLRLGTNSSNTTGKFVIRTGGADRVYVDQDGNMGFGVSPALSKIQILNGNGVSISTHGYLMLGSVTGSNVIFDNNEIMARNNGSTGHLILQRQGGAVRIGGTAAPNGYKFAVDGKMICEEVKVKLASSGWPDYVFEKTYQLQSLSDVEKFIQTNKHLPNIPSATEVEKNGIELGDMQKRLMEKIEELTLYIIEQEKRIKQLEKKPNKSN